MTGSTIFSNLLGLLLVVGSSIGHAQEPAPAREKMPPIPVPETSVLDEITERMTSGLQPERDASPEVLAGNQLRRLVIELAARGHAEDAAAAIAALDAIRLSEAVGGLTRRLERLDRPGALVGDPPRPITEEERTRAFKRLETFHRVALDELRRCPRSNLTDLDDAMSLVLDPIKDAIEALELRMLDDPWPSRTMVMSDRSHPFEVEVGDARSSSENGDATRRRTADLLRLESLPSTRPDDVNRLLDIASRIDAIEDASIRVEMLEHHAAIVEIVIQTGSFDSSEIERQLQPVAKRIQDRNRRDLGAAIEELERMMKTPRGSESIVELRSDAAASADDLKRLMATGGLVEGLTRIRPNDGRRLSTVMRRLTRQLAEERTRSDAARRFDRIASDFDRFTPLSIEPVITIPDERMSKLVAGRSEDLLARIDLTRRGWAGEIANDDTDGPARRSLLHLERLGRMLIDVNSMAADDPDIMSRLGTLNRWGGWYVSSGTIGWAARTIAPGLRLAADAAANGDFQRLAQDLDRLERQAPPTRLLAWFSSHLEPALATLDGGSVGALAAVSIPPAPTAWGVEHRVALARICRGFAELDAARQRGDAMDVERISRWVTGACHRLLEDVSSSSPSLPKGLSPQPETDA